MKIHTAEPLVCKPTPLEVEIAIVKLKNHRSAGIDQILGELIQAGHETLGSEIEKPIRIGMRKNCLSSGRSPLLHQVMRREIKLTIVIIEAYHLNIQYHCLMVKSIHRLNYWGSSVGGFDITDLLLIRFFCILQAVRKNGNTRRQYISRS
jgi:hypothetical protein